MDRAVRTLRTAVEPAAAVLSEILTDEGQRGADRIRAAVAVLDRTGVGPRSFTHLDAKEEMSFEELEKQLDEIVRDGPDRIARLMKDDDHFCSVILRMLDAKPLARFLRVHHRERHEVLKLLAEAPH